MQIEPPSPTRLNEVMNYDRDTGIVIYRAATSSRTKVGAVAGCLRPDGYLAIKVDGYRTLLHRAVIAMTSGEWPKGVVDHINGDRSDNRLCNLRVVSHMGNIQNQRRPQKSNKTSGLLGASWHQPSQKWQSKISVNCVITHLGLFDTPEEAHGAYVEAKRRIHPTCSI